MCREEKERAKQEQYKLEVEEEEEKLPIPLSEDSIVSEEPEEDQQHSCSVFDVVKKACVSLQFYVVLELQFYIYISAWITFAAAYYSSLVYLVSYGTEGRMNVCVNLWFIQNQFINFSWEGNNEKLLRKIF